jgi:hypothetical protein
MQLRRTVFGSVIATGLILGLSGCGGNDHATQPTPVSDTPPPTASPLATPTPVDPEAAAKAKVMADYKTYIAARSRGIASNNPTFPYDQVMTGNALSAIRSVVTGSQMAGTKYSGGIRFVKGKVASLNISAKPATAIVQACIYDGLKATSKSGKVASSSIETSSEDHLVLIDGRWKATETKSLDKTEPGCA